MKRTRGITALSLLLGWLALAGLGNAYLMVNDPNYGTSTLGVAAAVYACLALVACIGLWKMKNWAYKAYLLWAAVAVLFGVLFEFTLGGAPLWQFALFLLLVGAILASVARYIRKVQEIAL